MKPLQRTKLIQISLMIWGTLLACGFSSCSQSVQDICTTKVPVWDQRIESAIAALGPWRGSSASGRMIASTDTGPTALAQQDRADWQKWAEENLVETQHYLDVSRE